MQRGICSYGEACRFSHDGPPSAPSRNPQGDKAAATLFYFFKDSVPPFHDARAPEQFVRALCETSDEAMVGPCSNLAILALFCIAPDLSPSPLFFSPRLNPYFSLQVVAQLGRAGGRGIARVSEIVNWPQGFTTGADAESNGRISFQKVPPSLPAPRKILPDEHPAHCCRRLGIVGGGGRQACSGHRALITQPLRQVVVPLLGALTREDFVVSVGGAVEAVLETLHLSPVFEEEVAPPATRWLYTPPPEGKGVR